jgi:predicted RNase H-like HicB family nuclease
MKTVYPVIIAETSDGADVPYVVYAPDFDRMTQGESLPDALEMARDLVEALGVDMRDAGGAIPEPSPPASIDAAKWAEENGGGNIKNTIVTLIVADFETYRQRQRTTSVRRNVSLPTWLDAEATRAGINVSAVLQDALIARLGTGA